MKLGWGMLWEKSRERLKPAWLVTAGVVAIYVGAIAPMDKGHGIATERATGLSAVTEWEPISLWHQSHLSAMLQKGVIGGVSGRSVDIAKVAAPTSYNYALSVPDERKTIRTGSIEVIAKDPRDISEQIRQIAERLGGFVEKSETYGEAVSSSASLLIRVPGDKFEQVREQIHRLGIRVQSENIQAEDVTKQYVDQAARLRNLRAEEGQYLGILKSSRTVKDTLEVTEKLDGVRGEIEQQQAEFAALSKQVETVALSISLRAEADTQVFGLHWRPLYQLKLSARQGLESVGDYAASMISLFFYLPSILLWLATVLIGAALGWRILRWARYVLFVPKPKSA